jgi:ribosomal protein S18 acetylase RimI-like enzyme
MDIDVKQDCAGVDWKAVAETLKCVGMAQHAPDVHRRAFEASHTAVFVYHADRLIGFGRAISDGVYQAAIYDCAVLPEFQGKGIGTTIMKNILPRILHCNIILYASPGKEGFYQKHGFRKMKTGMAHFKNGVSMRDLGFTE